MSNIRELPDFIYVARLKDIFWNNNSDLYPTRVPEISLYSIKEKIRPTFLNPYTASCVLSGEFNHALYDGKYYILSKIEVIDIKTQTFKYQLDLDIMINFINVGGEVKGILSKTNKEDILEKCLQNTTSILSDPTEKKVFGFGFSKEEKKWQDTVYAPKIIPSEELFWKIVEPQISIQDWTYFIKRLKENFLGVESVGKDWLPKTRLNTEGTYNVYQHINPLFILDTLPVIEDIGWKGFLIDKINNFLGEKEKMIIVTQTSISNHFNNGKFCVSLQGKTLGSAVSDHREIHKIDLTGLKDIVPLGLDKSKLEPFHIPNKKNLFINSEYVDFSGCFISLGRVPHLPIYSERDSRYLPDKAFLSPTNLSVKEREWYVDYSHRTHYRGNSPQKVKLKDEKEPGFLWYLDKNNIAITQFDNLFYQVYNDEIRSIFRWIQTSTNDSFSSIWPFYTKTYDQIPSLGFLIFQLEKNPIFWSSFEYKGDTPFKKIRYRSGLKNIYSSYSWSSNKWYAFANESLLSINGTPLFSKITLDVDLFYWLTIAPPCRGYNSYKYYPNNVWGYQNFYHNIGGGKWYPGQLIRTNLIGNGISISNRYDRNVIEDYKIERFKKISDISIYSEIKEDFNIEKGDIFFSSLDYEWQNPYGSYILNGFDIDTQKIEERRNRMLKFVPIDISFSHTEASHSWVKYVSWIPFVGVGIQVGSVISRAIAHSSLASVNEILRKKRMYSNLKQEVYRNVHLPGHWFLGEHLYRQKKRWSFTCNYYLLESFLWRDTVEIDFNNQIVLYLYKGEFRLGKFFSWTKDLKLDTSSEQQVESVNDKTTKTVTLYHIKNLNEPINKIDYSKPELFDENFENQLLVEALCTAKRSTNGRIFDYNEENIKEGTHTFDLVGTDWMFIIHEGSLHLIPKEPEKTITTIKSQTKKVEIDTSLKPSTFDKINQKAELVYYGQSIPLNTKFNFVNDEFSLTKTPISAGEKDNDSDFSYEHISVESENDYINTWMTLPKLQVRKFTETDPTQYLIQKERLLQLTTNYEQDKYKTQLMLEGKKQMISRQREDLDAQWYSSVFNVVAKPVGGIVAGGFAGGGVGGAITGGVGGVASAKSDITFLIRYPQFMERLNEDEKLIVRQNSQNLYQRKQNYEHDFRIQTLKLNQHRNSFTKPGVSNRDVQEAFNKGVGYDNINVQIYLPSKAQSEMISHIFRTYGCECVSNEFVVNPLLINNQMEEGLYRFSKIEVGGINSSLTSDIAIRDIIQQIFENGTKFMDVEHEPLQEEEIEIKVLKETKITFDTTDIKNWGKETWDTYKVRGSRKDILDVIKKSKNYGLTDEEYEKNKAELEGKDGEELLSRIDEIIGNRAEGAVYILPPAPTERDLEGIQVHTLKTQIKDLEKQIADLTNQLNTTITQKGDTKISRDILQNKINELRKTLEDTRYECQQEKDELNKTINGLEAQKNLLSAQLAQANQKQRDLENRINQLSSRINQLNTQINNLEAQKTQLNNRINDLEAQKTQLSNQGQVSDQKIKELEAAKKECEETKKRLDEEIKKHKIDKEEAEQKWDNCKRDYLNEKTAKEALQKKLSDLEEKCGKDVEAERRSLLERFLLILTNAFADADKSRLDTSKTNVFIDAYKDELEKKKNLLAQVVDQKQRVHREKEELSRELQECRLKLVGGDYDPAMCNLLHSLLDPVPTLNNEDDSKGWNNLLRLMSMFWEKTDHMREADLDQHLLRKYGSRILPLIQKIGLIENIPMVSTFISIITGTSREDSVANFKRYLRWIEGKQEKDSYVMQVESKIHNFKRNNITEGDIILLKTLLDDLIWTAFNKKDEFNVELKTDGDLQFMFTHIFPSDIIEAYKAIFGDTRIGAVKRRFKELKCDSNKSPFAQLSEIMETSLHDISDIYKTPDKYPPSTIIYNGKVIKYTTIDKINGISLGYVCSKISERGCHISKRPSKTGIILGQTYNQFYKEFTNDTDHYRRRNTKKVIAFDFFAESPTTLNYYFTVDEQQKDLYFSDIQSFREELWKNKNSLNFNEKIEKKILSGEFSVDLALYYLDGNQHSRFGFSSVGGVVNLKQTFGDYALDAAKLILIMSWVRMNFNVFKVTNPYWRGNEGWKVYSIFEHYQKKLSEFPEYFKTEVSESYDRWVPVIHLEFDNVEDFLKYIALCVKDNKVYRSLDRIGGNVLEKLFDKIREAANHSGDWNQ